MAASSGPAPDRPPHADDPFQQAVAAMEVRRYAEAMTLAAAALSRDADRSEAWALHGMAAEALGDYETAEASLAHAVDRFGITGLVVPLATCLWRLGKMEEVIGRLDTLGEAGLHDHDVQLMRANALHALGRYAEAKAVAEAALLDAPDSPQLTARLGATLMRLGQPEPARACFERAAQLSPKLAHCRLIRVDRDEWRAINTALPEPPPEPHTVYESPAPHPARFVVVVACDAVYLKRYGPAFVRSFAANAARSARLHLHVVDPDDEFAASLDAMVRELALPGMRVTIEYSPDDVAEHLNPRRTYYSCARFLHLPWFMAAYRLPLLLLDIDAVVEHPVDDLAALVRERDAALVLREPADSPWLDVVANHVAVGTSPGALRFAQRLRAFIMRRCKLPALQWHLDQIALYCVLEMAEAYGEPVRFAPITAELQQRMWHIGNFYRYQLDDERFRRYAQPFSASARK